MTDAPALARLGFAALAGVLSTLSPCVLPLLPLVFGAAVAAHRFGVFALCAGLVLSFVGVGLFVATVGFAAGLDGEVFRWGAAVLLGVVGVVLLSGRLQGRLALATGRVGDAASRMLDRLRDSVFGRGLGGSSCSAPCWARSGAPASGRRSGRLPARGAEPGPAVGGADDDRVRAGHRAAAAGGRRPVAGSDAALARPADGRAGGGKLALGGMALLVSLAILTGADHRIEAALVDASPAWLTDLTTRF